MTGLVFFIDSLFFFFFLFFWGGYLRMSFILFLIHPRPSGHNKAEIKRLVALLPRVRNPPWWENKHDVALVASVQV